METARVASIFKVLADDKRVRMIALLGEKDRTVGELEQSLSLSQSSTSQYLKLLKDAGLVDYRKHGNFRIYSLRAHTLRSAMSFFDRLWDQDLQRLKTKLEQDEG